MGHNDVAPIATSVVIAAAHVHGNVARVAHALVAHVIVAFVDDVVDDVPRLDATHAGGSAFAATHIHDEDVVSDVAVVADAIVADVVVAADDALHVHDVAAHLVILVLVLLF